MWRFLRERSWKEGCDERNRQRFLISFYLSIQSFVQAKTGQENGVRKKSDSGLDRFFNTTARNDGKSADPEPDPNVLDSDGSLFDLDQKVRRDVVCDGILWKFRDRLRGDGFSQNTEQPVS